MELHKVTGRTKRLPPNPFTGNTDNDSGYRRVSWSVSVERVPAQLWFFYFEIEDSTMINQYLVFLIVKEFAGMPGWRAAEVMLLTKYGRYLRGAPGEQELRPHRPVPAGVKDERRQDPRRSLWNP